LSEKLSPSPQNDKTEIKAAEVTAGQELLKVITEDLNKTRSS